MRHKPLATLTLSFLGCGFSRWAPGTVGTAGAIAAAWAVHRGLVALDGAARLAWSPEQTWAAAALLCAVLASIVTVRFVPDVEDLLGKDPGLVVTDEVAGTFVTLAAVPEPTPAVLVAAFFVFRVLDVAKPWPASWLERLPSGWGVLLDDVMSGVYGTAVLALATRL